MGNPLKRSAG